MREKICYRDSPASRKNDPRSFVVQTDGFIEEKIKKNNFWADRMAESYV